jgi:subtilisin family serine protease
MRRFAVGALLFIFLAFFTSFSAEGSEGKGKKENRPKWVEGEVIVTYRRGEGTGSMETMAARTAGVSVKRFEALSGEQGKNVVFLRVPGKSTEELLEEFSSDPGVESVSPNYILRILAPVTPNDPRFTSQWGLNNTGQDGGRAGADIDAPIAWGIRTSALTTKVVAIIDTGITKNHEDLKDNLWTGAGGIHGRNCVNDNDDPEDDNGHGTHVAGIIGAKGNNGKGTAGVAWNVKLMAVKMLDYQGSGTSENELEAYDWILRKKQEGVDIVAVNASYGGGGASDASRDAIEALGNAGILFIAAAGNAGADNDQNPEYPASYNLPNIISVAATDRNDALASYSSYGRRSVHLAAPGSAILNTWVYEPSSSDIFFDDMESGAGKWVTSADSSPQIHWRIIDTTRNGTATKVWTDGPDQHYPINQRTYLSVQNNIDLSGTAGQPVLFGMKIRCDLESGFDYLYLQFSKDGGSNWTTVHEFTGGGDNWTDFTIPVPAEYRTASFRFRFFFKTDHSDILFNYAGVQIDNVGVGWSTDTYIAISGTSMATPFVTGAAALVSSQFPGESPGQIRSRILGGVDRLSSLSGKVSTGGRLNLARSLGAAVPDGDSGGGGGCSVAGIPSLLFLLPLLLLVKK